MFKLKICAIFMVLFLSQAFCKPAETPNSVDTSSEFTPQQELSAYIGLYLIGIGFKYTEKCIKLSSEILKDEDFLSHQEPMILEFKQNLTKFVDFYDANKDLEEVFDIVEMFNNSTEYYYEIPEDKHTPETRYIVKILDKYNYKSIETEMEKELTPFVTEFMKIFEEHKSELDKPTLEWYEKYQQFDHFEEKFNAFASFLLLVATE